MDGVGFRAGGCRRLGGVGRVLLVLPYPRGDRGGGLFRGAGGFGEGALGLLLGLFTGGRGVAFALCTQSGRLDASRLDDPGGLAATRLEDPVALLLGVGNDLLGVRPGGVERLLARVGLLGAQGLERREPGQPDVVGLLLGGLAQGTRRASSLLHDAVCFLLGPVDDVPGLGFGRLQQARRVGAEPFEVRLADLGADEGDLALQHARALLEVAHLVLHLTHVGVDRMAVVAQHRRREAACGRGPVIEEVQTGLFRFHVARRIHHGVSLGLRVSAPSVARPRTREGRTRPRCPPFPVASRQLRYLASSTSSSRTPPASLGCTKLMRESAVPRLGSG